MKILFLIKMASTYILTTGTLLRRIIIISRKIRAILLLHKHLPQQPHVSRTSDKDAISKVHDVAGFAAVWSRDDISCSRQQDSLPGYIVWLDRKMTRVNRRRSQEPKRETTLDSGDTTVWRSAIRGKTIAPVRPEFLINVVFRLGCSKEEGVSKEIT